MVEPRITTVGPDASQDEVLAVLDQDGGVIVSGLVDRAQLQAFNAELDNWARTFEPGSCSPDPAHRVGHGERTRRFCGLTARSSTFLEVLLHPTLEAFADHLLLGGCGSYLLNTAQVIEIGPGERAQFLHRDEDAWPEVPRGSSEITASTVFALTDFTRENGATRFVPGSHLWDNPTRQPVDAEIAYAEMQSGSVLLFSGRAIHGGGENRTSSSWRRGLQLSFVLGWLRPEENHYLATGLELARALPRRAQELLGYASYRPAIPGGQLGLVDFAEAEFLVRGEPPPTPTGWGV